MIRFWRFNNSRVAAAGLGVAISILLYFVVAKVVDDRARQQFENLASKAQLAVQGRVDDYADVLNGLSALFQTSDSITRLQFRRYIAGLNWQKKYPGIQNLNYVRQIPSTDRNAFEAAVRQDRSADPAGYPQFAIKPPGLRAEYNVITYIEPMQGFEDVLGFDIASIPDAALALNDSRDTGKLVSSGRLITRDGGKRVGLAMRLPLYQSGLPLRNVAERRAAYRGSIGAGFDVQRLMSGALDNVALAYMHFRVYDTGRIDQKRESGTVSPERLLFDSHPGMSGQRGRADDIFITRISMEVGGRAWETEFSASKKFMLSGFYWYLPWLALFAGLLLTVLLFGIFYSLASSRRRAIEMAKIMTKDLRASEASLADAQHIAHVGNWLLDATTGNVACSAETFRIFGMDHVEGYRPYSDFTCRMPVEDGIALRAALERSLVTGQEFSAEYRIAMDDSSEKWVQIISRPGANGRDKQLRGTIMDITERKRIESALQDKNIELENSNRAKDRFLANMSHELRTPLNAIVGFTGMLLMKLPGPLTPDQDKQLKMIKGSARHLLSLINDLLDLTKIESGKVELNVETVVCQEVLAELVDTFHPLAEEKGLTFTLTAPAQPVEVKIDRRGLSQILINLINNAIKFTETGSVEIELREIADEAGPRVEISVIDSGVGIRPGDQAKLFQAFTQIDASSTKRFEGTGLGLHLSQKLASLLDARIVFESEHGKGSKFTLILRAD